MIKLKNFILTAQDILTYHHPFCLLVFFSEAKMILSLAQTSDKNCNYFKMIRSLMLIIKFIMMYNINESTVEERSIYSLMLIHYFTLHLFYTMFKIEIVLKIV